MRYHQLSLVICTILFTGTALGQRTLMFDAVQTYRDKDGKNINYKQCYVILPSEQNQEVGTVLQLAWRFDHNRVTEIGIVAGAKYSTVSDRTTFQWQGPGAKKTEVARIRSRIGRHGKYCYTIESHDDKAQVGDAHHLTQITWAQLPPSVRNAAYENSIPHLPAYLRDSLLKHREMTLKKLGKLLNQ